MTRTYTLKKRADQQAETRQRIVEAAVELHGDVGPAATTFSMVAERAGVQRHTLYAHFPDERSLLMACSGLVAERDPPPDALTWRDIEDGRKRLSMGLRAVYDWFERSSALFGCVFRDAERHALTREISELRFGPATFDAGSCAELLHLENANERGRPATICRRQSDGARDRTCRRRLRCLRLTGVPMATIFRDCFVAWIALGRIIVRIGLRLKS